MAITELDCSVDTFNQAIANYEDTDWVLKKLPLGILNQCMQIRKGDNPVQSELQSSIEARGQQHAISVGYIGQRLMSDYVKYTNDTWGGEQEMTDLIPTNPFDDHYFLIVAGHSRVKAIRQIAKLQGKDPDSALVYARLFAFDSIDQIIHTQRDENIHSSPSAEREARALVEDFIWQRKTNPKLTQKAYAEKYNLPVGRISDALMFASLPPDYRNLVEDHKIPFSVGILLGKAIPTLKIEAERIYPLLPDMVELEVLRSRKEFVERDLQLFLSRFNRLRNIGSFKAFINNHLQAYKNKQPAKAQEVNNTAKEDIATSFMQLAWEPTPEEQQAEKRLFIERHLKEAKRHSEVSTLKLHQTLVDITGSGHSFKIDESLKDMVEAAAQNILNNPA